MSTSTVGGRPSEFLIARRGLTRWLTAALGTVVACLCVACKDTNVPYFIAPTSVPNSPDGIQNAMTGLFAFSRNDVGGYTTNMSGFARDVVAMAAGNPQILTMETGLAAIPAASDGIWDNEYRDVGEALDILAALPNTSPSYSPAQAAAIVGIVQTLEAVNLMLVAETRDTLGIPIHASAGAPGPAYCNKDVWRAIVALLDSANGSLNTAGGVVLPVTLPPGFASVSAAAGPSTVAGSFAALNRALAGKAGLELAYAIARSSPATHPSPTNPGAPDVMALTRADSAITASALYNPSALAPPKPGPFADPMGVYWDFSAQSGDQVNPVNQFITWYTVLNTFVADVDTLHDLRWTGKFEPNPYTLQLPAYSNVVSGDLFVFYPAANSPIPLIRNEGLVLTRAQIQLGMGNLGAAVALINQVHQQVGGYASPLTIASTYTAVRDTLLKEQRISTVLEGSGDRTIALRMYNLEAVADTTWGAKDLHTTVIPVEAQEVEGRNGSYTLSCP